MRAAVLAIAVLIATGIVACGGDDESAQPLTLEQRLLTESEVPGSKEDPVEVRQSASGLDELAAWEDYVRPSKTELDKLEQAGFVSAVHDTRFIPKTPGGEHTPDAPHVRMIIARFGSEQGAGTGADLLYAKALEPCPGQCALRFEKFDPSGVPDARGVHRYVTAEALKEIQEPGEPFDDYTVVFADGPFAYAIMGFGPPGAVSKEQVEEIAQKVHDRVEGAPAPA
jgi:hypothetical protein